MAAAIATITPNAFPDAKDLTFDHLHIYGTISIAAGTYNTNGVALNWNIPGLYGLLPSWVDLKSVGSPPGLYSYVWDKVGDTIRILVGADTAAASGTAPFSEFPSGNALPQQLLNDVIAFHAIFRRA